MKRAWYAAGIVFFAIFFILTINKRWDEEDVSMPAAGKCRGCNVILIMVDAMRVDHMSCYGYELNTTPNICKLAEEGVFFRNMHSNAPSTKPSVASLFTSMYPSQHKAVDKRDVLSGNVTTLAEILVANGYNTYAVNSNPMIKKTFNFGQGFMGWVDADRANAADINSIIFDRLGSYSKPFFLYVHYIDPHSPYKPPGRYYKLFNSDYKGPVKGVVSRKTSIFQEKPEELRQLTLFYDNELAYVDSEVGRLIERLKQDGTYDGTVIILTADHGEMFMEHGRMEHSNGVYGELINIPLVVRIPGGVEGKSIESNVQTVDILPTILDTLNIATDNRFMGASVFSAEDDKDRITYSEHLRMRWKNPQQAIIMGRYKLIKNLTSGRYQMFDLQDDKAEKNDIIDEGPQSMRMINSFESLSRMLNSTSYGIKRETTKLDAQTVRQLRELNYVD